MYEAYFHLDRRPFVAAPRTEHYFPARSIEQARQSLTRCISRSEGPGAIIGPSGTGKSLLCFVLAKQFRDKMKVALVQGGRLRTRKSLLQNVLYELKQPFRGMDEDELRLQLLDHLEAKDSSQRRLLLIIDDAHLIRGQVLADVASLCGHVRDGEPVIQFVLAGGPALEEKLAHPRLESLQQRIAARCYLQAFSYDETQSFIRAQIENCGGNVEQVIAGDAIAALYRASDGVPRLINQIGDHALLLSYLAKLHPVTKAAIEESWSDLQQLPTPWQVTDNPASVAAKADATGADETTIIEFGSLNEAPAMMEEAPANLELTDSTEAEGWGANPTYSLEQNLWTIESGLEQMHQVEEIQATSEIPAWEPGPTISLERTEVKVNDMPSIASSKRENHLSPTIPLNGPTILSTPAMTKPVVKRVANPFEEQFEVEEVIVEKVARKPGKMIETQVLPMVAAASAPLVAEEKAAKPAYDEDRLEQFDGVSVDWLNYQATSVVGVGGVSDTDYAAWNVISTEGATTAADARPDDRNVLLVENDEPPRIRPVKRQEFRQLFAKMRGDN